MITIELIVATNEAHARMKLLRAGLPGDIVGLNLLLGGSVYGRVGELGPRSSCYGLHYR